jgi:hypothetical protein
MAMWKTVFIFASEANGWSEVWYQDIASADGGVAPSLAVATKRDNLCGIGATLEAIRLTTVDKPKKSFIFKSNLPSGTGSVNADTPWNAILARVFSISKDYSRTVMLRAPVDDWLLRVAPNVFQPQLTGANAPFNSFVATLKQYGFRFSARDKTGAGGTVRPATNFTKDAVTGRISVTVAGSAAGPGSFVTFADVTGFGAKSTLKGRHKVKSNAGGIIELETVAAADVFPAAWSAGTERDYILTFPMVDTGQILRAAKRSTGRRFFVTRGRRSKAKT